jgi:hypothetical protein
MPTAPMTPEPMIRQDMHSYGPDVGGTGMVVVYRDGLGSAALMFVLTVEVETVT